jgi:hypothetical protein
MNVVRPGLLRGPNFSRIIIQVHDIHAAAATSTPPASAPAFEFMRGFLDTGAFFVPSTGQFCEATDAQMLLYGVSTLLPNSQPFPRLRHKLTCISVPQVVTETASAAGAFTAVHSRKLAAVCSTFMQSLREATINDFQADKSTADVASFLTTAFAELRSLCGEEVPRLHFDMHAAQSILQRVHADLAIIPFDFERAVAAKEMVSENMAGNVMFGLFGRMVDEESNDDVGDSQANMQQFGTQEVLRKT